MSSTTRAAGTFAKIPTVVARDVALSDGARSLYMLIASYVHNETRTAKLSAKTLTARTGKTDRSIRRLVSELEVAGYLQVVNVHGRSGGRGQHPKYLLPMDENPDNSVRLSDVTGAETRTFLSENPDNSVPHITARRSELDVEELLLTADAASDSTINDLFETFWESYPRKTGKIKASNAFKTAAKVAPADRIILGVRRLAADPNLPEKKFIPHPATWLARGGWDDEPYPPKSQQESRAGIGSAYAGADQVCTGAEWMEQIPAKAEMWSQVTIADRQKEATHDCPT